MASEVIGATRRIAHNTVLGNALVEYGILELDTWLNVRKLGGEIDDDPEHSSIKVGHGRAEEEKRPDEGVLVVEFQIDVNVIAAFEVFHHLLELTLQVVGNTELILSSLKTLLGPTKYFLVDGLTDDSQTPQQLLVVEHSAHLIARTLKWHLLELGALLVLLLHSVDGLHVRIVVPQEAALAEILERLELFLGRREVILGVVAHNVLLVRRNDLVVLLQTLDDRDANGLMVDL